MPIPNIRQIKVTCIEAGRQCLLSVEDERLDLLFMHAYGCSFEKFLTTAVADAQDEARANQETEAWVAKEAGA